MAESGTGPLPARTRGGAATDPTRASGAGGFGRPSLLRRLFEEVQNRLTADLDDRDPDFIRENLALSWLIASIWFRGEVRGLEKIPEEGPVLLVGNHWAAPSRPTRSSSPWPSTPTSASSGPSTSSPTTWS